MKKNLRFFLICFSLFFFACKKNNTNDPPPEPQVNDTETVTASVVGIVVNENNIPVSGATVKLGTQTGTTDTYGMFRFRNISISKNNGHIKVTKAGYFNGNRSFITTVGRTHNIRIKLIPKTNTGTITASAGGTVTLATGGKVTIPANAITDASGNAYTGTVNVAMAWINPLANDLASIIQGDLRGVTTAGNERVLETYGMLGVELTGSGGQELKIASGKTAELSTPIPVALQAAAPATIPLWHFDETRGRWTEEGNATKVGTNYVGTVSHFSFWNCDVPMQAVTLCVNVVNTSNQPLNNVTIRLKRVSNPASVSYGVTDSLGNVCGLVPKNEALVLEVLGPCGNVVYSQNIGPFSANASVNIVATIPPANMVTLTGTVVNCSNAPVTNGNVFIQFVGGSYYYGPVTNGSFSFTILNCTGNTVTFSATAIDNTAQQQGNPVNGSGISGTVNLGQLVACGTSLTQFINLVIDGTAFSWAAPPDSLFGAYIAALPPSTWPLTSYIYGNANSSGTSRICNFNIQHNFTPGAAVLIGGTIIVPGFGTAQQLINTPVPMTITEFATTVPGFTAGNFSGALFDFGGTTRTVSGNFRVRRY